MEKITLNFTAPINSLGYGVCGLNLLRSLSELFDVAYWPIGQVEAPAEHHDLIRGAIQRQQFYDVYAPSLRLYHQFDLAQHVGRGVRCAMPIFELNRLKPVEKHHVRSQELVFVNSAWAKQVLIENGVEKQKIRVVPLGVDRQVFSEKNKQESDSTIFVNIGKWEVRKGHADLVEAFNKAFTKEDNVKLLMNCFNPCFRTQEEVERYNSQWVSLYKNSPLGEKIFIYDRRLPSQKDVAKLMAAADCGVFPAKAEGWNLEAAEMLAMGKHVILTDYSAHTEFATPHSSLLISIDEVEDAHDGIWFRADAPEWQGAPGQWAKFGESQMDQLIEHMRSIHRRKQQGELQPNLAGLEHMSRFTWENSALAIMKEVDSAS